MRNIFYQYIAYNADKQIVKGKLEANNEEHAAQLLNFVGYQLVNIKTATNFPTLEKIMMRLSPVKPTDVILFYRQVALLVESGLNIVTSIELLQEQTTNRVFKRVLAEIVADIRGGSSLSAAMGKHPQIFSQIY